MVYCSMKAAVTGVLSLLGKRKKNHLQINSHIPGAESLSKECTSAIAAAYEITI